MKCDHEPERDKEWQSTETAPQDEPIYFSLEQVTHWMPLPAQPSPEGAHADDKK